MPYRDFDTGTWSDPWVEQLKPLEKLLFIYLWTNNHCNQAGLYYISTKKMAEETDISQKQIDEFLPRLEPKVLYDSKSCLVFIRNFVRKQRKSDTFLIAVSRCLEKIKPHVFLKEFAQEYQGFKIAYLQTIDKLSIAYKAVLYCSVKEPIKEEKPIKDQMAGNGVNGKFERFWNVYPKKKSKGQAEKAFKSINPDEQLLARMIATIERAKTSRDWIKESGQYIPYPGKWLNAKGWEDDIEILPLVVSHKKNVLEKITAAEAAEKERDNAG